MPPVTTFGHELSVEGGTYYKRGRDRPIVILYVDGKRIELTPQEARRLSVELTIASA